MTDTQCDAQVRIIADGSPELEAVKKLWRKHSSTLGFFPEGAFSEYAQRGHVVVAERSAVVVGYTLFRRTGTRVAIVHLCVDAAARGKGVARLLLDEVSRLSADADGVSLKCRRDFDADKLWPKLGFRPVREVRGRGRDGALLTVWLKSHGHNDLFSLAAKKREPRTVAVIDANVFFDLAEVEERASADESRALEADWLKDVLELRITHELFDEIGRHGDGEVRRHNLALAQRFNVVECTPDELDAARRAISEVLPVPRNQRDRSDREHLARCVAARLSYFITRDGLLLEYADALWERTNVEVLRPGELVVDLDELERAEAYRPARFAGTSMRLVPANDVLEDRTADAFRGSQRRAEFLRTLRSHTCSPRTFGSHVVLSSDVPVGLLTRGRDEEGCFDVPLLNVAGPDARTLASYLAHHIQAEAVAQRASVVVVDDAGLDPTTRASLEADDFSCVDGAWLKLVCPVVGTREAVKSWVEEVRRRTSRPVVAAFLAQVERSGMLELPGAVLERVLWPLKVLDEGLPTFVVPVRPSWAQHLFDAELASLDLFGAKAHLAMSRENVYYRSPTNPATLPTPARILWYVSAESSTPGTKAIRACSRLVEVMVGPPKVVYKAGRRLGIYDWKDVAQLAEKSRNGHVQALRFCDTECFRTPVPLHGVQRILEKLEAANVNRSFPSPQPVSELVFAAIYRAGRGAEGEARGW